MPYDVLVLYKDGSSKVYAEVREGQSDFLSIFQFRLITMFNEPVILYGSSISYFTGKMENYFQIRSIPYVRMVDAYPAFKAG